MESRKYAQQLLEGAGKYKRQEFFTIGLVLGENPGEENAYLYKQSVATFDKRYRWIRIQQTLDSYIIRASDTKALPKK